MSQPGSPDGSDAHHCQQCGHNVEPSANFCPQCGTAVGATYCPDCGEPFAESAAFCSHCGSERPTAATSAVNSSDQAETYAQFRRRVASYTEAGWDITADHGDRVTVVDRDIGSIGVHVLLLLFTGGFLNIVYGWYQYSKLAETRNLVVGGTATGSAQSEAVGEDQPTTAGSERGVMAYVTAGLLWFISLTFLTVAIGGGSLAAGLLGLLFAAGGTHVLPPVNRRVGRRLGVTRFGRHKTVDHRIIRPHERCTESCVVCGCSIDQGVVRRRRDETVVAGVPIRTHLLKKNHYCAACAHDEFVDTGLDKIDELADLDTEPATAATD